ncbi:MAG: histidine phosphatase family protein [Actinomycetota bacterium]
MILRLVRHGETDWASQGRYTGVTDVGLNVTGVAQAESLGVIADQDYTSIWCSDLTRCTETARLMGVDATPTAELREFDFGRLEGLRWDDLDQASQDGLLRFDGFAAPGGERVSDFAARIDGFVDRLGPGHHLVIGHGGVVRHLLRRTGADARVEPGSWRDVELGPPGSG